MAKGGKFWYFWSFYTTATLSIFENQWCRLPLPLCQFLKIRDLNWQSGKKWAASPPNIFMFSPIFWSSHKQLADPTFNNIYPVSHKLQKQRQTWAYLFFRLMTWHHRTCPWYHRKVWWDREGILWRPSEVSVPMTSRSRGGGLLILSCLCSHLIFEAPYQLLHSALQW